MLGSISIQTIEPAREDVYLASLDDQETILRGYDGFCRRLVLRSQLEPGAYWVLDCWESEDSLQMALAAARTLSTPAALLEEPVVLEAGVETLAEGPHRSEDRGPAFFLVAEGWVKAACLDEYLATVRAQAGELALEPGFRRRLLLRDGAAELHFWVLDEWESEHSAYAAYSNRQIPQSQALRFLSLFAERGRPLIATGVT